MGLKNVFLLLAFACVLAGRIYFCTQTPIETTDAFHNLGYAAHLTDQGLNIYHTRAIDFSPEPWTKSWSHTGFLYPPVALIFFWLFSVFHLGIFYLKLSLTLIELGIAAAFARFISPLAGLLYFSMPVSIWFVSHEGQYEPLVAGFLCLAIMFAEKRKWIQSGLSWGLALQSKQLAFVLAPWLIWKSKERENLGKVIIGLLISGIPFIAFYLSSPQIFFAPLQNQYLDYNPFAWNFLNKIHFRWNPDWLIEWNQIVSYSFVLLLVTEYHAEKDKKAFIFEYWPIFLSWILIKSLGWAQFWYVLTIPVLALCFCGRKRLVYIVLTLMLLQCGRSIVQISGHRFGIEEYRSTQDKMTEAMWKYPIH